MQRPAFCQKSPRSFPARARHSSRGSDVLAQELLDRLCGSGLIDAAAVFLRAGIIDETGAFTDEEDAYSLTPGVSLTQKDIRMLQLAKSAICAGMLTLLEAGGLGAEGPARLVIAGRKTIDDVPEAGREAVRAYIAGLDEGSGE